MNLNEEQLQLAEVWRDVSFKKKSYTPIAFSLLSESIKKIWYGLATGEIFSGWSEEEKKEIEDEVNQIIQTTKITKTTKERNMTENNHSYSFVTRKEDVDFIRIIKEAPKGSPFILVVTNNRIGQPQGWHFFVHNDILNNEDLQGLFFGTKFYNGNTLNPSWGYTEVYTGPVEFDAPVLRSYRYISGNGKFPGYIKQQIETIRRILNPKNIETVVTFL